MNAKNILGYLVFLIIGAGATYLFMKKETAPGTTEATSQAEQINLYNLESLAEKLSGPISRGKADTMIKSYRGHVSPYKKTHLVWHHQDSLKFYIDSIFMKYTAKVPPPFEHEWKLAMSPMFYKENGRARLTFCFLPCLVNITNDKKGYEFFEEMNKNSQIYNDYFKKLYEMIKPFTYNGKFYEEPGFIFDEGQLWP